MGVGPIPASSVSRWADRAGLDEDETETFRSCIRAMDRAYLAYASLPEEQRPKSSGRELSPELFDALFG
jgi:hypothetical protein